MNIDLASMTPQIATGVAIGWGLCYLWLVQPLKARVEKLEAKYEQMFQLYQDKVLRGP